MKFTNSNNYQLDSKHLLADTVTLTDNTQQTMLSAPGSGLSYYIWGWTIITDKTVLHDGTFKAGSTTEIAHFGATTGSPSNMTFDIPVKVGDNESLQVKLNNPGSNRKLLIALLYTLSDA